jgi:two-component system alkaline phosphatase synthesis response regulator PhoP
MPSPPRLLLVEDDPGLQLTLSDRLTQEGYAVEVVGSGERGLERAKAQPFDLLLLDVMLPGISGFDVCVALRQAGVDVPILMVTARGQLGDRVAGLKLGADDYLVKPFEIAELLARVEARVRRASASSRPSAHVYRFGDVTVDTRRQLVERHGNAIDLGAKEYRLLCYFLEREGRALPREELLSEVWGYKAETMSRTLDVHVSGLRRKLERHPHQPSHLLTVHGLGYKFVA